MKSNNNTFHKTTIRIISIFCVFIILYFSENIKSSITSAIDICLNTIVPAIFPMLIVSYIFIGCNFSKKTKKIIHPLLNRLFGLSGNCIEAIIAGLSGGYNTSSKASIKLLKNKIISKHEAQRLALFFSSPGISFCINISGAAIYRNKTLGIQFLIASIMTCFISAFLSNLVLKNKEDFKINQNETSLINTLVTSVSGAAEALISICSWVIFFNILLSCFNLLTAGKAEYIMLFGEAVSAVDFAAKNYPVYISAFSLFFGGFSIFLQQLPDIITLGIKPSFYLIVRLIQALICALIQMILSYFFPVSISVSNNLIFKPFSHSVIGSSALLLLCLIMIKTLKETYLYANNNQ